MGDDSSDTELDYFPKIETKKNLKFIKFIIIVLMKLLMLKNYVI